jgi:hypothetical protein
VPAKCQLRDELTELQWTCLTVLVPTPIEVDRAAQRRFAVLIALAWVFLALGALLVAYRHHPAERWLLLALFGADGVVVAYLIRHWQLGRPSSKLG